jgi:hypothetical protein
MANQPTGQTPGDNDKRDMQEDDQNRSGSQQGGQTDRRGSQWQTSQPGQGQNHGQNQRQKQNQNREGDRNLESDERSRGGQTGTGSSRTDNR